MIDKRNGLAAKLLALKGRFITTIDKYEYGTIRGRKARRDVKTGKCQFILWRAGEQGHDSDYWHDYGDGHEQHFKLDK